jgi:hypothetical protein
MGIRPQSDSRRAVSSAGNLNGDGIEELAIGAPYGGDTGECHVVYGRSSLVR